MHRKTSRFTLPEHLDAFLKQLAQAVPIRIEIHCIGAFAAFARYRVPFEGSAIEYIAAIPPSGVETLRTSASEESDLAQRTRVHLRFFGSGEHVEGYERRMKEVFPGRFEPLRLCALEAHDLVLAKLGSRNTEDALLTEQLIRKKKIASGTLRRRYREEVRPLVANPKQMDRTFRDWLARYF